MKKTILPVFLCLFLGLGVAEAQSQLKIDFNVTGGAVAPGYKGYFATRSNPATFTAQSYSAFGATVTIQPTWASNAANAAMAMIDRGTTSMPEAADLLRDWIGTDTRQVGDPMTLTIKGLPAGHYQWLSYHHDRNDQTGLFDVTVNDAAGAKTTTAVDISNGTNFKLANVTKFTTTIRADGTDAVTLVFDVTTASAFFVMNGFELTWLDVAAHPSPAPGTTDVSRDGTVLSWSPGQDAVAHDVYLATTYDAIDDGTVTSTSYQGRVDANSYEPGRLQLGQVYYWRVDEVQTGRVIKGDIWSFTAEPVSIPLAATRITATASSSNSAGEGPEKTIDSSGLSTGDVHGTDATTMWLSALTDPGPVWIQYRFDKPCQLHQMLVWNHNSIMEATFGLGAQDVTIDYSLDGVTWTPLKTVSRFAQASGVAGYAANTTVDFGGAAARCVRITIAGNWSGVWKQYGLSEVRFLIIPVAARQPVPAVGATGVDPWLPLRWRAGREAGQHQVYLGTDPNAVRDGTAPATTVAENSLDAGRSLELGRTYYWKVNEVNDLRDPRVWEGDVWSFSTSAAWSVDNMESYDANEANGTCIFQSWEDGFAKSFQTNGAQVGYVDPVNGTYGERTTVHGGTQSLPLQYGNGSAKYSEATRTFEEPQDWTLYGIKGLTLWFCGNPANTAAAMYLKINGVKAIYDGEPNNILQKPWHFWYVDLSKVAGLDLKKITKLTIGFEGGKGTALFDDIRLVASTRQMVTPTTPAATNLVAHYLFDGNVADATGAHPGTVAGAPTYTDGKVGQAIKLNGTSDYVFTEGTFSLPSYTVALWFRVDGGTGARDLFSCYDEVVNHGILVEVTANGTMRFLHRAPVTTTGNVSRTSTTTHADGQWYHVAAVKSATTMTLYINGEVVDSAAETTVFDKSLTRFQVGMLKHTATTDTRYFPGAVDDLYLYSRDLSQAEVAALAGWTLPFDMP